MDQRMPSELRKILNFRGRVFHRRIQSILAKHPVRQLEGTSATLVAHVHNSNRVNDQAEGQQCVWVLGPLSAKTARIPCSIVTQAEALEHTARDYVMVLLEHVCVSTVTEHIPFSLWSLTINTSLTRAVIVGRAAEPFSENVNDRRPRSSVESNARPILRPFRRPCNQVGLRRYAPELSLRLNVVDLAGSIVFGHVLHNSHRIA